MAIRKSDLYSSPLWQSRDALRVGIDANPCKRYRNWRRGRVASMRMEYRGARSIKIRYLSARNCTEYSMIGLLKFNNDQWLGAFSELD
jgi:hypothetical protein